MPLKWEPGGNPYRHNYFGRLRLGPGAIRKEISEQAKKLALRAQAGDIAQLAGRPVDEHAINEASKKLLDAAGLAHELLLVHPLPPKAGGRLQALCDELRTVLHAHSRKREPFRLSDPLALFWLVPPPGAEVVELPDLAAYGLVGVGDQEDIELDVVFDG